MISLYAKIDQRAWALGYIVKRFAKVCIYIGVRIA